MKHVAYKYRVDYEKEEKWLNEMAGNGMNLVDYAFCRYVFEEGKPGQYIYRIELLSKHPRSVEGMPYIRFMEEMGIECVATYMKWAYFRKKADGEPFDLFSDHDSKIAHFTRVSSFSKFAFGFNLAVGLLNVLLPVLLHDNPAAVINPVVGSINLIVAAVFSPLILRYGGRLKKLKAERQLRE
jgi:hypothetical protein